MVDDYTNDEGESILEADEVIDGEDVYIKRFAGALKTRLDNISAASASAYNFRTVAQTLGEITQDETMVAAIHAERQRRLNAADRRQRHAQDAFFDTVRDLKPGVYGATQAARFAVRLAVGEEAKLMVKHQQAQDARQKAQDLEDEALDKLRKATSIAARAKALLSQPSDDNRFRVLPEHDQERLAGDALVQYKEALAQYRADVADAQCDYAERLKSLRDGQGKRLTAAVNALSADTVKALPDAMAEVNGTRVSLRAVR